MTCWEVIAAAGSQNSTLRRGLQTHYTTTASPSLDQNGTTDCVCAPGHARTQFGECVPEAACFRCKPDYREDFSTCATGCPLICNYTVPDRCYVLCIRGCFCIPGHIRSTPTGPCVPVHQCPPRCTQANMEFSECASADPPVCNVSSATANRAVRCLNSGCRCLPGYILHPIQYNTCIPRSQCFEASQHHNDTDNTFSLSLLTSN
ncbi:uncharacterized protein LOC144124046 [Amblyomma americanum]